jgi:3-phenylpropionate/trans-cinnamate dioxygenase ferredoxin reductase component
MAGCAASRLPLRDALARPMRVVIVGAGQAGGWVAATLRGSGFDGEIVLVGEEEHPPYERPPLSKDVLLGEKPPESTHIWPEGLGCDHRRGMRARRIDRTAKRLELCDGSRLEYDKLVLATGGRVRRLDRSNAHYLRTIDDALALRAALLRGGSVLVIGGGWIGLETAAAARKMGCAVTVVEAADRLCARVLPSCVSDYLHDLHRRRGVDIRLNADCKDFCGDVVVVGIGIVPNSELAEEADLEVANGIVVDEFGATSDPDIYAVGDVANLRGLRLESWANAQNQAIAAAKSLLGTATAYREIPWFWSDQHGVNIQMLGVPRRDDSVVLRGDPARDKVSYFFMAEGRITGLVAVNTMRDVRVARMLMEGGKTVPPAILADETRPLQNLLKA